MSSRWYPLYQKGNPQLRVFLPNFWMKMVKPPVENIHRKNQLMFHVSMGMSRLDVKNYLESIYKVPVVNVRTYIKQGDTKTVPGKGYVIKDDDYKVAWVMLPKNMTFEFPDIFPQEKISKDLEDEKKNMEQIESSHKKMRVRQEQKPEVPGWFL